MHVQAEAAVASEETNTIWSHGDQLPRNRISYHRAHLQINGAGAGQCPPTNPRSRMKAGPRSAARNGSPALAPRDETVHSPSTSRLASLSSSDHYTSVADSHPRLPVVTAELASKRLEVALPSHRSDSKENSTRPC